MNHSTTKIGFYLSTIRLKDYSFLFFLLLSINCFSQNTISGIVLTSSGVKLPFVEVYNKTLSTKTVTNSKGEFSINIENSGSYEITFYKENYLIVEKNSF